MSKPSLTKEELKKIIEAVAEAYKKAGKEIKTATMIQGDDKEILIDNRKPEENN